MSTATVSVPEGQLCVGQWYLLRSDQISNTPIRWIALTTPPGVASSDVMYLGEFSQSAYVQVPVEGTYAFAVECCEVI